VIAALVGLDALARQIADHESAGRHDSAAAYWGLFDDAVAQLSVDELRVAVKQLLVARSDSSVALASGPRGLFSRLVAS
jgi:hypothetical protein